MIEGVAPVETDFERLRKVEQRFDSEAPKVFDKDKSLSELEKIMPRTNDINKLDSLMQKHPDWQTLTQEQKNEFYLLVNHYDKNRQDAEFKEKAKTVNKEPDSFTSFVEGKDFLAEQVFTEKGETYFCVYDVKNDSITYEIRVFKDGLMYAPIVAEEVTKRAIYLPSAAKEYGDDKKLDTELKNHINRWLDIPPDFLQFAIWNIKRSWVFQRFHTLNYLRALGDTGQGKSRFLDTLGLLHYKPIKTSGATTSAPVFRIIDKWKGTLIMDEADFKDSDESQDIIKIINLGYEAGQSIMRCDQNDAKKINFFDPFCPKAIGTRRAFEDKAVESRCITHVMKGTQRQDIPLNLNNKFFEDTQLLRNKLLMWRFRNYYKINPDAAIEFDKELEPRVKQIVSSFAALFTGDEEQKTIFRKFVEKHQAELIEERQNSFDGQIVGAIHKLISEGNYEFDNKDIVDSGELKDYKGNLLNPRALTSKLKALGFEKTLPKKVDGKTKRIIPFTNELINILFKRYGYEVTKVTVVTGSSDSKNLLDFDQKCNEGGHRNNRNDRNSVTYNIRRLQSSEALHMACKYCGLISVDGWLNEDLKDGRAVCDMCAAEPEKIINEELVDDGD